MHYLSLPMSGLKSILLGVAGILLCYAAPGFSQGSGADAPRSGVSGPDLVEAVVAEDVRNWSAHNPAVVFSVSQEKVFCFSRFEAIPSETLVYHQWYYQDEPMIQMRLKLYPPSWSTFSSINLRESDIGPWRVEITDTEDNILSVIRFSVTD